MQARPTTLALAEVPELLFASNVSVGAITAYNDASAAVVYLKIWAARETAPNPATDAADYVFAIPSSAHPGSGHTTIVLFSDLIGPSYWAATDEATTGATAPDSPLLLTATYERRVPR